MTNDTPSWELYRTFLGVLTQGSLSGAAREIGMAQPTVGRHVDALEKALGLVLFTRSQVGFLPTEAALALRLEEKNGWIELDCHGMTAPGLERCGLLAPVDHPALRVEPQALGRALQRA